jgi:hypothetical protein
MFFPRRKAVLRRRGIFLSAFRNMTSGKLASQLHGGVFSPIKIIETKIKSMITWGYNSHKSVL